MRDMWKKMFIHDKLTRIPPPKCHYKKEAVAMAKQLFTETNMSLRQIQAELQLFDLNLSLGWLCKLARSWNFKSYKMRRGQKLTEDAVRTRLNFSSQFYHDISTKKIDLKYVIFTDESTFEAGYHLNRQNDRIWDTPVHSKEHPIFTNERRPTVSYWAGVNSILGVIGPYCIEDLEVPEVPGESNADRGRRERKTNTTPRYNHIVRLAIEDIKSRLDNPDDINLFYWQQDGASVHRNQSTISIFTETFGNRLIAMGAPEGCYQWPPYSPDLTVMDFWFWNELKRRLNRLRVGNKQDIKECLPTTTETITRQSIAKSVNDTKVRLAACKDALGRHFEFYYKRFKGDYYKKNNMHVICEYCNKEHDCDCNVCQLDCEISNIEICAERRYGIDESAPDMEWDDNIVVLNNNDDDRTIPDLANQHAEMSDDEISDYEFDDE